jgi:hypothetical protein
VPEACAKLAESDRAEPKLGTALALAKCEKRAGRQATALAAWRDVEARAAAAKDGGVQQAAKTEIAALETSVPRLTISVDGATAALADAIVRIDGRVVDRAAWASPQPVDLGRHRVEASARGRKPFAADVDVTAPSGAQVNVPALEDAAPPKFVEVRAPKTIDAVGDARWNGGFGFVLTGGRPIDDDEGASPGGPVPAKVDSAQEPPRVPELRTLRLPGFFWGFTAGVSSYDAPGVGAS